MLENLDNKIEFQNIKCFQKIEKVCLSDKIKIENKIKIIKEILKDFEETESNTICQFL